MKTKKCMYCLKAFETDNNSEKYCSEECETKSNNNTKKKSKKEASGGFSAIIDFITSLF